MECTETMIANQYLSFTLRHEHFAVEISRVREVLDVTTLTRIPRMPAYLAGVINLRGNVLPVVDLGLKLGMPPVEKTVHTCIMIVEIEIKEDEEKVNIGVLTDMVLEVLDLNEEEIQPTPKMGCQLNTEFIRGMGHQDDKFLILLDIDKILSDEETAGLCDLQAVISTDAEQPPDVSAAMSD